MPEPLPVLSIGTDIAAVDRFARLIDSGGRRFLDRWFSPAEVDHCLEQRFPARHVAARFAAKEAALKSLRLTELLPARWREIEVTRDSSGLPGLMLHGEVARLAARAGAGELHLSLSHEAAYATATVLALAAPPPHR